jgi:hypothetical protein
VDETAYDSFPDADRDALLKGFEEHPGDFNGYGVAADLFDELGYARLAYAFRWMHFRRTWPRRRERYRGNNRTIPDRFRWAWYGPGGGLSAVRICGESAAFDTTECRVPEFLHARLAARYFTVGSAVVFPSRKDAITALSVVCAESAYSPGL